MWIVSLIISRVKKGPGIQSKRGATKRSSSSDSSEELYVMGENELEPFKNVLLFAGLNFWQSMTYDCTQKGLRNQSGTTRIARSFFGTRFGVEEGHNSWSLSIFWSIRHPI